MTAVGAMERWKSVVIQAVHILNNQAVRITWGIHVTRCRRHLSLGFTLSTSTGMRPATLYERQEYNSQSSMCGP